MSIYCTTQILQLASDIYTSIDSPSAQSVAFVSGWITNGMLGSINNKLGTDFTLSGEAPCIAGEFGAEEGEVAKLLYQSSYYRRQALVVLAGGGSFWTSIREGDSSITRANVKDIAKGYMELHEGAEASLRLAVHDWKLNHSLSVSVDAARLASWPSPS